MNEYSSLFNWSLSKLLATETRSFNRARLKILFTILSFTLIKLVIVIPIAIYHNQPYQLERAVVILVIGLPRDATFVTNSSVRSSNAIKTPGSLNSVAPRIINSRDNNVFPLPASPHTRVGRLAGNPPPVISSSPVIPVGVFGRVRKLLLSLDKIGICIIYSSSGR